MAHSPPRLAAALLVACAAPAAAQERPTPVAVDWTTDGAVAGGAAAFWLGSALLEEELTPTECRWCTPPALDARVRDAVVWSDPEAAATASDVLVVALPAGLLAYDRLAVGSARAFWPDLLLVTESVALSGALAQATKFVAARERPYVESGTRPPQGPDDRQSFYSGHSAMAFSAAASTGMLAQLRGDEHWPWVYGVGFAAAAATGYLRMAGDRHWLTDVLAGAATGTAIGLAVPWLHRDGPGPGRVSVQVAPRFVGVRVALD